MSIGRPQRARRPWAAPGPSRFAAAGRALAALGCAALAACGPAPTATGAPTGAVLYVANGGDGTLTRIDATSERVAGPPLPGGPAPWQLVAGPPGVALAARAGGDQAAALTYVAPDPGGRPARPLPLEPGARGALLAGGGRHAAVAYQLAGPAAAPGGARCRLVRVDLERGSLGPARDVCAGRDSVVGLAASGDSALLFLALWRRPAAGQPCDAPTGSRIVALRADTGAPVASAPLAGVPGPLALGAAPGGGGQRLYAAEALPAAELDAPSAPPTECAAAGYDHTFAGARAWRVWSLDATTLAPEGAHAVPAPVRALAVAPDGGDAFVLAGRAALFRLGPADGAAAPFAVLPDQAFGLAATDARVFTVDVFGDAVWSLDRHSGRRLRSIPTGRRPLGLALAGAGPP